MTEQPTDHKTMNTIIHAAFRRDLERFESALAAFPAGSHERAEQLGRAWDNYAFQLHHHHEDEETIFWPMLSELGADESLVGDLDGEHARMLAALEQTSIVMQAFRADPTAENVGSARTAISGLSSVLLDHLAHEERDLEPFAVAHLDTPQWKSSQVAVRKAHKGNTGMFMTWLLDGADPTTAAALKHEVPPPVLWMITHTAGRRYTKEIAPTWA